MKKLFILGVFFSGAMTLNAADNVIGGVVDSAASTTKSKTDSTANPVVGTTHAVGMEKTSQKASKTQDKTKGKTDHAATKVKNAVGATQ